MFFCLLFYSCTGSIGAGSLGGWEIVVFPVTEAKLESKIDSLYVKYPEYLPPEKWQYEVKYWDVSGYNSMKSVFFYFNDGPEELYYVTFIDAGFGAKKPEWARIAIRAIYHERIGWKTNENVKNEEKERIRLRFRNEIVSKLERFTKTKIFIEK